MTYELSLLMEKGQRLLTKEHISSEELVDMREDMSDLVLKFIKEERYDHLNTVVQNATRILNYFLQNQMQQLDKTLDTYKAFGQLEGLIACSRGIVDMYLAKKDEADEVDWLLKQDNVLKIIDMLLKEEWVQAKEIEKTCGNYVYQLLSKLVHHHIIQRRKEKKFSYYGLTNLGKAKVNALNIRQPILSAIEVDDVKYRLKDEQAMVAWEEQYQRMSRENAYRNAWLEGEIYAKDAGRDSLLSAE